jgi:hypothetical protein
LYLLAEMMSPGQPGGGILEFHCHHELTLISEVFWEPDSTYALSADLFDHPATIVLVGLNCTQASENLLGSGLYIAQDIVRSHVSRRR